MKVYDAYRMAIEAGMSKDPRPRSEVRRVLDRAKEAYERLPEDRKELFDQERLWNPYADSRFSALAEEAMKAEADTIMWGIDVGPAEVLLADRLREKGRTVSAVAAHHPIGVARTCFPEPPVKTIPLSIISAESSGFVADSTSFIAFTIFVTDFSIAVAT